VATYEFWVYEVSNAYLADGSDTTVSAVWKMTVTDGNSDPNLQSDEANDPGSSQRFWINGVEASNYQFYYDDTDDIDGTTVSVKSFALVLNGTVQSFIMSATGPSIPGVTVGSNVSLISYSNYTSVPYATVACFTPGTMIRTSKGEAAIETLSVGDRVWTRDHGLQPIRWIGTSEVSIRSLMARPHLRPVIIPAHAFGPGRPARDMAVSPQHRVLLSGWSAELHFAAREVLAPAKGLVGSRGIRIDEACRSVTYIHMMFDAHEIVLSDGLETESFLVGATIRDGMDEAQRDEILELFPELAGIDGTAASAARPLLKVRETAVI
jgi:hypothetical protein